MADPRSGKAIFDERVEYPLPKRRRIKDDVVYSSVLTMAMARAPAGSSIGSIAITNDGRPRAWRR
jgi:hypothetical protein